MTDEPASKVEPFIKEKGINYLIALGGASGYKTRGIPHAWLVSPKSEIVWHGHPNSLKDSQIEELLRSVRLVPTFELPDDLKKAESRLNRGQFASGISELERYLEKPKSDEGAAAAKDALKKVNQYGNEKLVEVEEYAKEGFYADGIEILASLEKMFKGTEIGDKASDKRKAWLKDKTIKAEIQAGSMLAQAESLLSSGKAKNAIGILQRVAKSRKFADTTARKRAIEKLRTLGYE